MDFSISGAFEHFTLATWLIASTLLIMSVLSLGVALNRAFYFMRARAQSLSFAGAVGELLENTDIAGIVGLSEEGTFKFSYLARIVRDGLVDAQDLKAKDQFGDLSTVSSAMERAVADEAGLMKRWMTILATVSSTAPFVGLLGTVFGIINSFKGMEASESAGLSAVAGGIAEALIMTGFGLVVAIPAVWLYNWAIARVEGFNAEMGNSASEMLDWIKKNKAAF